jgi:hypothetical protein
MVRRSRLLTIFIVILAVIVSFKTATAQGDIEITIFRSSDSLTIYFPSGQLVNVAELRFEFYKEQWTNEVRRVEEFSAFWGIPFNSLPTPFCLHIARANTSEPLPLSCQGQLTFRQSIANSDVFWFDSQSRTDRTLYIYLGNVLGVCASEVAECELVFEQPTPTPTFTLTFTPTVTPTATPTNTLAATPTPTFTPTNTPTSTPIPRKVFVRAIPGQGVNLRSRPNTTGAVVTVLHLNDEVTILAEEPNGEFRDGTSLWYYVRTINGLEGYIHSRLVAENRLPSIPTPTFPASTGNTTSTPTPGLTGAPGGCTAGSIIGTASDLFAVSGRRRVPLFLPANAFIEATLFISNQVDPWGARVVLEDAFGQELSARETFQSPNPLITTITYTTTAAGEYRLGINGDSTHTYNYEIRWNCRG